MAGQRLAILVGTASYRTIKSATVASLLSANMRTRHYLITYGAVAREVRAAAIAICVLGISSCTSAPPERPVSTVVQVPAAWSVTDGSATAGTSPLAQWWSHFADPQLTTLVSAALRSNTSIMGAQAALRQARAERDVAAAAVFPTIDGSASALRSRSGDSEGSSFETGLDATWELDIFGANRSALRASEAAARASLATLGDMQISIAAEVALTYITLRGAQDRLAIASANLDSEQEILQITLWRLQAGLVTSLEAEQARAAVEQTRAQLPALLTSIGQSGHALAVLTGQPPAALSAWLSEPKAVPRAPVGLKLAIPAETLRQRPDVRAAEHQVTAALARVAQASAARAPNFQLGGSLGLSALTPGSLINAASLVSTLLAQVSIPVFDAGARGAQVRVQEAAIEQARVAYQATVLTALSEVEDALIALGGDRERLSRLQLAAEAAANASLLARQRYSSGLVDFQVVLETQRTQLTTQESVATATADLSADHVRLYKALGGGWNSSEGEATSP